MQKIKKEDEVIVIAGKDKGATGVVNRVLDNGRLFVSGVNMVKKHVKANPQDNQPGGIIEQEAPIRASNVAIYNRETGKADKVGIKMLEDGRKVRVFKSSGEEMDTDQ
ncbi:MAG: 50S ribosomal protein L24 [Pseudomonadales bacterium]